jgi:sugar/nucleoside kinase (ribokinase family)
MTPKVESPVASQLLFAGITTVDLVQATDKLPRAGEKAATVSSYLDVGGPAANAAITASMLGASVSLLTVIGDGPLSDFTRDTLAGHGVVTREQASDVSLPISSIWVDAGTGERTVLASTNASARLGAFPASLVPDGTVAVLLDGHYAELALAVARQAQEAGIPIVLDCGRWRPVYTDLIPLATEVIACATFRPPEFADVGPEEAVAAISERWRPELCAMTRGGDSILVASDGGTAEVAVRRIAPVDTLGAGDVLHGAYVYYRYTVGLAAVAALRRAAELATESCRSLGARRGLLESIHRP